MKEYLISNDPAFLDREFVVRSLRTTYWAGDRPREVIEKSLAASLSFGVYADISYSEMLRTVGPLGPAVAAGSVSGPARPAAGPSLSSSVGGDFCGHLRGWSA